MSQRERLLPVEWLAIAVGIFALGARLWPALVLDLDGDEAYYTMWSAFLQPGYLDHPPAIALFIAIGRLIAGEGVLGVRLFALLAGLATLAALYRTTRLLAPGRGPAALAIVLYCLTLQAAIGFVATPDAPSTLFWTLAHWAAAEAITGKRPSWWLAVGLFAGAGLASKYTNAWFGIGLVLFLFATVQGRIQLKAWQLWVGGLLAIVVFSPVLWWNWQHDWRSFQFQGARLTDGDTLGVGPLFFEFLASQAMVMGPVLVAFSGAAAISWLVGNSRQRNSLALPVLTSAPILLYFAYHALHSRVQVNWTQPVLPVLALLAAAGIASIDRQWLRRSAVAVHVALGAAIITAAIGQATFHPLELGVADRTRMLRGWEQLAAQIRGIADENGARVIWAQSSYQLAGELFFYGLVSGDSRPVRNLSPHPRYGFLPQNELYPQDIPAIVVQPLRANATGPTPPEEFEESTLITILARRDFSGSPERYAVFLVTQPSATFPRVQ